MPRLMLTDEMWSKLKAILLEDRVYNKREHRYTIEGILYRLPLAIFTKLFWLMEYGLPSFFTVLQKRNFTQAIQILIGQ